MKTSQGFSEGGLCIKPILSARRNNVPRRRRSLLFCVRGCGRRLRLPAACSLSQLAGRSGKQDAPPALPETGWSKGPFCANQTASGSRAVKAVIGSVQRQICEIVIVETNVAIASIAAARANPVVICDGRGIDGKDGMDIISVRKAQRLFEQAGICPMPVDRARFQPRI